MAKFTLKTPNGTKYQFDDTKEIHRGGEGRILTIDADPNIVAKIYHDGTKPLTEEQFDFLSKLDQNLFVSPKELLLDAKTSAIVGFTMQYLGQDFFPLSALFAKNFCLREGIDENVKNKITAKLIESISIAHKNNVTIGDFNQFNILINKYGEVRLIDTDSYGTPNHAHSGILLEDIRDYLYNGVVSEKSDFFALSILIFNMLTYTHPFKGIHKTVKKISDRMLMKIPIFANDSELILPKCYEPLYEPSLQTQFDKLYLIGERFLFSLTQTVTTTQTKTQKSVNVISEKDVNVTVIVEKTKILNTLFGTQSGYIETTDNYLVFKTLNKGYVSTWHTIPKKDFEKIFVSSKNVFLKKGNKLFLYKDVTEIIEISNYEFPNEVLIYQYLDILVTVGNDIMSWIYMNEVINTSVQNRRIDVFSRGFKNPGALIQNSGGVSRIFYNSGKEITTVKFDVNAKQIYQQNNIGIVQYTINNEVKNEWFAIKGMNVERSGKFADQMYDFANMPITNGDGYLFQPADNKINVINSKDFQTISMLECSLITEHSRLQHTLSGIVTWEGTSVYLLNKK